MQGVWIHPSNCPTREKIAAYVHAAHAKFDDIPDLTEALAMEPLRATEFLREVFQSWMSLEAYLMAFKNGHSLTLMATAIMSPHYADLLKAQANFTAVRQAVGNIDSTSGEVMDRVDIPKRMWKVVDLVLALEAENEAAGGPEDVDFTLDEIHAEETGFHTLVISMLGNSGLAISGDFAHYCVAAVYVTAAVELQEKVALVLFPTFEHLCRPVSLSYE